METPLNDTDYARKPIENVEIVYLSIIVSVATILNLVVFVQLIRQSRTPTARTSFLSGPYHLSSFTLFKLNLCITDFMILLIHALGKIVWLIQFDWRFGNYGCKAYMFLSALGFYANSNIIVAIGLDRLKVVYTSHVQGATSVRRVRLMLSTAWLLAIICSIPQLFVWETYTVNSTLEQCTSIFTIAHHENRIETEKWYSRTEMLYEISHQAAVFWIPFSIIFVSYFLIVVRLLHYTLTPPKIVKPARSSASHSGHSHSPARVPSSCEQLLNAEAIPLERLDQSSKQLMITSFFTRGLKHITDQKVKKPATSPVLCCTSFRGLTGYARSPSLPVWHRQVRSRIFLTALAVVVAHVTMWLPYNLISTLRFIDPESYVNILDKGATFLEDLIVVNSLLNPLLYAYKCR